MKILRKTKTFRFSESTNELLDRAKKNHIKISKFVREAISEKFERDYSLWVKEQKENQCDCPF